MLATEPRRVRLTVAGRAHPAIALELNGQRAALKSRRPVFPFEDVRVELDWTGGAKTSLPAVVRSVAVAGTEHLVHVDLTGVEGDWRRFLAYVGGVLATR